MPRPATAAIVRIAAISFACPYASRAHHQSRTQVRTELQRATLDHSKPPADAHDWHRHHDHSTGRYTQPDPSASSMDQVSMGMRGALLRPTQIA